MSDVSYLKVFKRLSLMTMQRKEEEKNKNVDIKSYNFKLAEMMIENLTKE